MTILYAAGMDLFTGTTGGAAPLVNDGWTLVNTSASTAIVTSLGRFGGRALRLDSSSNINLSPVARLKIPDIETIWVGLAIRPRTQGFTSDLFGRAVIDLSNNIASNTSHIRLNRGINDQIRLLISGSLVDTSPNGVLTANVWSWLEVQASLHATDGFVKVWVNGKLVIDYTGSTLGTGNPVISYLQMTGHTGNSSANDSTLIDDIIITDGERLGDCRIDVLTPSADVEADFTPSSGSDNYAMVDDVPSDGDTSYVTAESEGDRDIYELSNLQEGASTIYGVKLSTVARKTDAGDLGLKQILISDTQEEASEIHGLSTNYQTFFILMEKNPDGDVAWDTSAVNALKVGVEVA